MTDPAVNALTCPACGGTVEMRAAGYSVTIVCQYCSSVLDVANPDVRIIERYEKAARSTGIPLGTRGVLRGVEWEAIGYLRRSENATYPWEEYLLFNPYHGYRWLTTDGRGWSFSTALTATPKYLGAGQLAVDGDTYDAFFRGSAQVDYVLGEFYWRIAVGERVETADYVRPGAMLSFEGNDAERNWTLNELLAPKEIEAFGVEPPRAWPRTGQPPLPHQPSPYRASLKGFFKLGLITLAALIFIVILFGRKSDEQSFAMALTSGREAVSQTFGPIILSRPSQAVTISANAPEIENLWVDIDYALVDRKTQASYEAYGLVERYSGRDSDGAWTEGSRSKTTKLAIVPAGTYDLVVDASASRWSGSSGSSYTPPDTSGGWGGSAPDVTLRISIAPGGFFLSNLILALIVVMLPFFYLLWRHATFETARRGESDFASSDDDDEDDDE
jgi:hypothetical protein